MNVPDLKGGQMITIAYIIGILVVLFIVYKIMAGIGLVKTAKERKTEAKEETAVTDLRSSPYFDPLFLKGKTGYTPLGATADTYAELLKKGIFSGLFGATLGWNTDEEKIYSAFTSIGTKYRIAEVALAYNSKYDRDLRTDLMNNLGSDEALTLSDLINNLPTK